MGGNQPTLVDFIDSFLNGLSGTLKDHLAPSKLTVELESSIKWASEIDKRLFHWNGSREEEEEEERYIYCTQFEPCMASCQVRSPTPNAASLSLACQTNLSVPSERRPTGVTLQSDSRSLIFQALRFRRRHKYDGLSNRHKTSVVSGRASSTHFYISRGWKIRV